MDVWVFSLFFVVFLGLGWELAWALLFQAHLGASCSLGTSEPPGSHNSIGLAPKVCQARLGDKMQGSLRSAPL